MTTVAICSLFRNCAHRIDRWLALRRALAHPPADLVHVCVEGDSRDDTPERLRAALRTLPNGVFEKLDTFLPAFGSIVHPARLRALSESANLALRLATQKRPDLVLWLESDLEYPPDLIARLAAVDKDVVAPMVLLEGTQTFYDIWAYREGASPEMKGPGGNVGCFQPAPPYHPSYRPDRPFRVDSAGSVLLIRPRVIEAGARFTAGESIVGFCREARARGFETWVDPKTVVAHPDPAALALSNTTQKVAHLVKKLRSKASAATPSKVKRGLKQVRDTLRGGPRPPDAYWEARAMVRFQETPPVDPQACALGEPQGYARPLEYGWVAQRARRHVKTLDVGTGDSPLPAYLASRGLAMVCVDKEDFLARHRELQSARGVCYEFLQADAKELPFASASFEQCIALSAVEHEREDARLMKEIRRVCAPGATVLLTLPYDHFGFWLDDLRPACIQYYYDLPAVQERILGPLGGRLMDLSFVRYFMPSEGKAPFFTHPNNAGIILMQVEAGR